MVMVLAMIGIFATILMSHMSNRSMSSDQVARMARVSEFFGNASGEANSIRNAFFNHGGLGQFLLAHQLQNPQFNPNNPEMLRRVLQDFFDQNAVIRDVEIRSVRLLRIHRTNSSNVQLRSPANTNDFDFDVAAIQIAPLQGTSLRTLEVLVAR